MNDLTVIETPHAQGFLEPAMPRRRQDAGRTTIAGRKADNFVFNPRESTFFFPMKFTLSSLPMQIAFAGTFERCQLALFETELIAPLIARDDEAVLAVNGSLDKIMKAFETYMDQELIRANKILEDNARALNSGDYTAPKQESIRIFTPRTKVYVQMLQLADSVITVYGRLWLEGFMNEINFKRSVFAVRMRAINLARDVWQMHTRSFISLKKARTKADAERARIADERERNRLEAKIKKADEIIKAVDERGGMEIEVPDFGKTALTEDSPELMKDVDAREQAAEQRKEARRAAKAASSNDDDASDSTAIDSLENDVEQAEAEA